MRNMPFGNGKFIRLEISGEAPKVSRCDTDIAAIGY